MGGSYSTGMYEIWKKLFPLTRAPTQAPNWNSPFWLKWKRAVSQLKQKTVHFACQIFPLPFIISLCLSLFLWLLKKKQWICSHQAPIIIFFKDAKILCFSFLPQEITNTCLQRLLHNLVQHSAKIPPPSHSQISFFIFFANPPLLSRRAPSQSFSFLLWRIKQCSHPWKPTRPVLAQ